MARSNKTVGLHYIRFQKIALGTSITCLLAAAQNYRNRGRHDELGLAFALEDVDQFLYGSGALVQLGLLLVGQFDFVDLLYSAGA
jgi:hypothetical protein